MARGGRRAGNKGTPYPNRTDLQGAQLPPNAPTGLPYGDRAKLIAAQREVPMGPSPAPPAPMPGVGAAPGPASQEAPPIPGQGIPGGFAGPTQRPAEPVTAGLPIGPGPGPEVLNQQPGANHGQVATLLQALASAPGATSEVRDLATYASSGRA